MVLRTIIISFEFIWKIKNIMCNTYYTKFNTTNFLHPFLIVWKFKPENRQLIISLDLLWIYIDLKIRILKFQTSYQKQEMNDINKNRENEGNCRPWNIVDLKQKTKLNPR